ncbi:MAG TPA: XRE family transcriptional regulator [Candidatus Limnocylindria bacterium]|nr:XRE family transcriptional regulator [Candidatus Limnocylindria bacterium]
MPDLTDRRRRPLVGRRIRHRRQDRGLTLSAVSEATGLNIGYLSQVENDKASPSLETLAALATALDVPIAWFLLDASAPPRVVRAADRPVREIAPGGQVAQIDGGLSRDLAIFEAAMAARSTTGFHSHPGDEHHVVISGTVRIRQGETVVDAGPGDYVLLDGTLPHDVEVVGETPARLLIVYPRGGSSELGAPGAKPPGTAASSP